MMTEEQEQWAITLLSKDKSFARMTESDRRRIMSEAEKFGSHLAEKARAELGVPQGSDSIRSMLETLGCVVRLDEKSGLPGPMSQYEEDLSAALFFTRRIRDTACKASEQCEWSSGWYDLFAQCLAKELFHHIEHTMSGKASHHIRIQDRFLGLIPVSRPVEVAREIACLIFVKQFLDLPAIPGLISNA